MSDSSQREVLRSLIPEIICPQCARRMRLATIMPGGTDNQDRLAFDCECGFDFKVPAQESLPGRSLIPKIICPQCSRRMRPFAVASNVVGNHDGLAFNCECGFECRPTSDKLRWQTDGNDEDNGCR